MKEFRKSMIISIIVNMILVIIKFTMGIISNYKSLVADAIHSFSDLSTDVVAIFGQWLAQKKEDDDHPYGHGKIEYITSIIIGLCILALGVDIICSTINGNVVEPHHRLVALLAVFVTIILKYALAKYIHYKGKQLNNAILIAGSEENMSDVLSAIGVFIAIILSIFKESIHIFTYADMMAGIIISILIIKTGIIILKDNISAIIGECEHNEEIIYKIKGIILGISDVLAINNLVVMKFGSYYQITLDVGVDAKCNFEEAHNISHDIEKELLNSDLKIKYVAVHISPCKKEALGNY